MEERVVSLALPVYATFNAGDYHQPDYKRIQVVAYIYTYRHDTPTHVITIDGRHVDYGNMWEYSSEKVGQDASL